MKLIKKKNKREVKVGSHIVVDGWKYVVTRLKPKIVIETVSTKDSEWGFDYATPSEIGCKWVK